MKNVYLFKAAAIAMVMSLSAYSYGQGMAVNTSGAAADASAILDASSTTQGMLVPRMTDVQRMGISNPATGLLVYQTNGTTPGFYYNSGTPGTPAWVSLNALSNVTTQGNSFNGTSQLVQTNGSGQLPALSGANLTNLPAGNLTGTLPALNASALTNLSGGNITNNSVTVGKISATGTPGATTYLDGSGAWSAPLTLTTTGSGAATFTAGVLNIPTPAGGGGTTATVVLAARNFTGGTITAGGTTPPAPSSVTFNTYTAPTIGTFNGTTYTVGAAAAGTYLIEVALASTAGTAYPALYVGGSIHTYGTGNPATSNIQSPAGRGILSTIATFTGGETLTISAVNSSTTTGALTSDGTCRWTIVKLN